MEHETEIKRTIMQETINCVKLEEIFSSVGRVKILQYLYIKKETNISDIIFGTKIGHKNMKKHLEALCNLEIMIETCYGRIKIYKLNLSSLLGKKIYHLLEFWNTQSYISTE